MGGGGAEGTEGGGDERRGGDVGDNGDPDRDGGRTRDGDKGGTLGVPPGPSRFPPVPPGSPRSPPLLSRLPGLTMPVSLELRLLLLALALRGEAVPPPVPPPAAPCSSAPPPRAVPALAPPPRARPRPRPRPGPACPRGCSDQGRCERGRCRCFPGWSGPDCGTAACAPGWGGARCHVEVPWVSPRLASRTPTSLRISWAQPAVPPDGYRVTLVPLDDPVAMTTHELPSSAVAFSVTGLSPGRPFELLVQARRGAAPGGTRGPAAAHSAHPVRAPP
ncbi:uncharacterized protein VK521_017062 [Ammospiza maritima maritima]